MQQPLVTRKLYLALSLSGLLALSACNGSSGSSDGPAPEPPKPSEPDPMVSYQWYLKNTGQDTLAGGRPTPGVDLNMGTLFEDDIRGKGVTVAVVDDGLDVTHEDLEDNSDSSGSINFWKCSNTADLNTCAGAPLLNPAFPGNAHGTGVGGLIGMVAMNGKGGRGIAPEVRLKGFNLLNEHGDSGPTNNADELRYNLFALGDGNQRAADVAVYNMSYGAEDIAMPGEDEDDKLESFERLMVSTRNGKGGLYIKAAGNEFLHSSNYPQAECDLALQQKVGCFDAATDPESSLMAVALVAAVNADGQHASYSSEGAPVWISGFGGEFNENRAYNPAASDIEIQPALFTTDWSGCTVGTHNIDQQPINAIDDGGASTIDPGCKYTASFNGTSAATPTVAAVSALMLQLRPELHARDVYYILAKSARHPENWRQDMLAQPVRKTLDHRVIDMGWHKNAKGVLFSRWYGYGLVDAQAAVSMARIYQPLPASRLVEAETAPGESTNILYAGDQAVQLGESSLSLTINDNVTVERVQIAFETTHTEPASLLVTLVSPLGTRIPALLPYTSLTETQDSFDVGILGVNGFLDEPAQGAWRLYVEDVSEDYGTTPAVQTQLTSFSMRILGHAPATP